MYLKHTFLHTLMAICFLKIACAHDQEFRLCFNSSLESARLNTAVHKKINVSQRIDCVMKCSLEPCCRSINFKKPSPSQKQSNCEMLHNVIYNTSHKLLEKNSSYDYVYLIQPEKEFDISCLSKASKENKTVIFIRSEGADDLEKSAGNGHGIIKVNGQDYSLHQRGYNLVTIDADTGLVLQRQSFDTHDNSEASVQMIDFLNTITPRVLVLIAIQDEGSRKMSEEAYKALEGFGALNPLKGNHRSSYALLGWSGPGSPYFITQVQNKRAKGPSIISKMVSFPV